MADFGFKLYGFIIFFVVLLSMWLWKKYKSHCNSFENQILTDDDETIPNMNYNVHNEKDVHYLFWTGGYDSTFRLCQLLLVEDKPVRPIYLMCGNVDDSDDWLTMVSRKNVSTEITTMKDIRTELLQNNTHLANKLLPTFYVVSIKKNLETTAKFKRLHKYLKYFSRDINQYERMARFSKEFKFPIEVGLENCGTGLDEATKGKRVGQGSSCQLMNNLPLKYQDLEIFRDFRFPICHLTKEEMKTISLNNNFYYLLVMTFSCWYPDKDGNACGKCQMCKKRIIIGI
jgi:hypothetical protein